MGAQASYGVALKSVTIVHKMYIIRCKVSSDPLPSPFSVLSLFLYVILEISRQIKCAQPIGKIFPPIPPLSLCGGEGWIADSEVDYEIGSPIPCFSLNTVSGYCKLVRKTERGKA
jgi:hypothetical protein